MPPFFSRIVPAERFALPWNLVTRHLHGHDLLRKKLHQKIN